jgi:hypothetical protein
MGRAGLCVGLAIAALFLGGCGAATPDGGSAGGGGGSTSASAGTSTSAPQRLQGAGDPSATASYGPAFPLTLHRTGGIAGFDDRIVLELNGRVHVETRSVHGRVCTLPASQQHQLVALLATLRLGAVAGTTTDLPSDGSTGAGPTTVTESDPITIAVTDDLARQVDLSDPSLGEISGLVGTLVSDVTLSAPATTRCTTGTSAALAPGP